MTKTILIVDDELQLLKVLKRILMKKNYLVYLAESGHRALEVLATQSVDMIITDLRMPGMDGLELLTEVKNRYPEVIRIVLSGYATERMLFQLFGNDLAKMCIYKPWDNTVLLQNVSQIFELNRILTGKQMIEIIRKLNQLPVLKHSYVELFKLMEQNLSMDEIEQLLMKDQTLAASILDIVNTAFFQTNTGSIKQAITSLGISQIKSIVLLASVTDIQSHSRIRKASYDLLSTYSNITNKICHLIFKEFLKKEASSNNFSLGLLQGIGRMVLMDNFGAQYEEVIRSWRMGKGLLHEIEKEALGISHKEMTGYLLNCWGLPYRLIEPILFHHTPWEEGIMNKELTYVLYLAEYYATRYMNGIWPESLDNRGYEFLRIDKEMLETRIYSELHIA